MPANDVFTLLLAAAGVAGSLAAIFIGAQVDLRATRSTLTDLTLRISRQTAKYDDAAADKQFGQSREIETLVLQAEFVAYRLRPRWYRRQALFPHSSVAATLAMALEKVSDFWWADRHWDAAVTAADDRFKVVASSYWGAALCARGELEQARSVVRTALQGLPSDEGNNCLVKADACLTMAQWDRGRAVNWLDEAGREYLAIPEPERREAYAPGGIPALTLEGDVFSDANLRQACLTGANLKNATLTRACLSGANLTRADLSEADLSGADLSGADLAGARLGGAVLTDANLTGTVLTGADLSGAMLGQGAQVPEGWHRDEQTGLLEPS